MPNITSVTLTAGVPTAGTGTVGTLDNVTGTAGSPSVPVLTVQGVASGTPQPISGTVTANAGSGTLATSLATLPALTAGSAIVGKVTIDQTTDGTTNKVAADVRLAGTAADKGSGTGGSATQRVIVDSSQLSALGQTTMSASAPVAIASDQSAITTQLSAPSNLVSGCITTAMTGTTTTSLIAAPGASLRNYITQITVSNSHATVGTDIIIQDGSGGTTFYVIPAAAVYGGATLTFPAPLRQPTLNTALFCANVTTGSSTKVSASGFKAA